MEYNIKGDDMPILQVRLNNGEAMYTESGGMAWMTDGIDMRTSGRGGGIGKMLGRAMSGESLLLTTYTAQADGAMIFFTPEMMGSIIALELSAGNSIIAQKDAFMCAEDGVDLDMHFRKRLGTGIFGGMGFILQKLTGPGVVFLEIAGQIREYDLKPGQRLQIDPGHIALFEPTIDYDITMIKGVGNMLFGGEGIFLATLTGPGRVWLQTMPLINWAARVAAIVRARSSDSGSSGVDFGDFLSSD